LAGEIDMACRGPLQQVISQYIDSHRRDLTVDVAAVTYLDSTALAVLTALHTHSKARGGTMRLADVPDLVTRILVLTGLDSMFDLPRTGVPGQPPVPAPAISGADHQPRRPRAP
jgi:anti-sigma B factor antagonist